MGDSDGACGWHFNNSRGHVLSMAEPRILDPRTASSTNATAVPHESSMLELLDSARIVRRLGVSPTRAPFVWRHLWQRMKHDLGPQSSMLPLKAGECADSERCVGIINATCVCSGEEHQQMSVPARSNSSFFIV